MPEPLLVRLGQEPHVLLILDDSTEYGRLLVPQLKYYSIRSSQFAHLCSNRRGYLRVPTYGLNLSMLETHDALADNIPLPINASWISSFRYISPWLPQIAAYVNTPITNICCRVPLSYGINEFLNLFSVLLLSYTIAPLRQPDIDERPEYGTYQETVDVFTRGYIAFFNELKTLPLLQDERVTS